jgi:hypothetical protein
MSTITDEMIDELISNATNVGEWTLDCRDTVMLLLAERTALQEQVPVQLVIGSTYESSRGFGRLLYMGETYDIDGWLPTFRMTNGTEKFYRHDKLHSAIKEFAAPPELVAALLAERAELKRDAERYRYVVKWLSHYGASGHRGVCMPSDYSSSTKAECDTSIDAAMQAAQ